jgi:alpha-L-fucosidase
VEAWIDNQWKQIAAATTMGYKRILKTNEINTNKIRVTVLEAKACPVISNIEIY